MPHIHADNEPHVTKTWGMREFTPRVVMTTLRVRPGRGSTEEERTRLANVIVRWVDRWADRHNSLYHGVQIENVRSEVEAPFTGNTLVVAWLAIGPMPIDWRCFAAIAGDVVRDAFRPPVLAPMILGGLEGLIPDLPDIDPNGDEKTEKVH
jgi:hypothetical protein